MAAEIEGASHVTPHVPEGTAIKSTGEAVTKYLRADGDDTSSWAEAVSPNYKITLDWGSTQTGVTYYSSDGGSNNFGVTVNIVEVTHGLSSRDVIVSVVDLNAGTAGGTSPTKRGLATTLTITRTTGLTLGMKATLL